MKVETNIRPQAGEVPKARMGGTARDIPILLLDGKSWGGVEMLVSHLTPQQAVEYLVNLADAAHQLADAIVAHAYPEQSEAGAA